MAKDKKSGGMLQPTPYNESPGDPATGNLSGGGIYHSYDEVLSAHLSQEGADLVSTPNMDSGAGIMGGPASGEPQPAKPKFSPTSESQ